jgi:hypothetical protein
MGRQTITVDRGRGGPIPVTGHGFPQGSEMSRLPHFLDNPVRDGDEAADLTCWLPFTTRKISGTHFC